MKIISIDPGMETGIVEAKLDKHGIIVETLVRQIKRGVDGLITNSIGPLTQTYNEVICEKFHPRQMARSYRMDELEPLRIEGYLLAHGPIEFRQPEQRHLFKEGDNFKKSQDFLKFAGLWTTGSEVGSKDANDANSAMMHLVSHLRAEKNRPIIKLLLEYQRSIEKEGIE